MYSAGIDTINSSSYRVIVIRAVMMMTILRPPFSQPRMSNLYKLLLIFAIFLPLPEQQWQKTVKKGYIHIPSEFSTFYGSPCNLPLYENIYSKK